MLICTVETKVLIRKFKFVPCVKIFVNMKKSNVTLILFMFFLLSSFVSCSIEIIEKREPITVNPNIKMGPSQFVGGCREIKKKKNDSCLLSSKTFKSEKKIES